MSKVKEAKSNFRFGDRVKPVRGNAGRSRDPFYQEIVERVPNITSMGGLFIPKRSEKADGQRNYIHRLLRKEFPSESFEVVTNPDNKDEFVIQRKENKNGKKETKPVKKEVTTSSK